MAKFFLTRRAGLDLLDIEEFSLEKWGEDQTDIYMNELYKAFGQLAKKPETGKLRQAGSFPFYMAPAEKHFAIYKPFNKGIIIAKILHGRQNIDSIIRRMAHRLALEIEEIEKKTTR